MMKTKIIAVFSILVLWFTSTGLPVIAAVSPAEIKAESPRDLFLTPADLITGCDWQQGPLVTRRTAEGILSFTDLHCGVDPNMKIVHQAVLILPRILQPGDANYFYSLRDIGDVKIPVQVGSWSASIRTQYDHWGIVFSKANVLVYIGPNEGYTSDGTYDFEEVVKLAKAVEGRIPDQPMPMDFPSYFHDQAESPDSVDALFITPPQFNIVTQYAPGDTPLLSVSSDQKIASLIFTASYREPHQTIVEVVSQNGYDCIIRWELPKGKQVSYKLDELLDGNTVLGVNPLNRQFLSKGLYYLTIGDEESLFSRVKVKTGG